MKSNGNLDREDGLKEFSVWVRIVFRPKFDRAVMPNEINEEKTFSFKLKFDSVQVEIEHRSRSRRKEKENFTSKFKSNSVGIVNGQWFRSRREKEKKFFIDSAFMISSESKSNGILIQKREKKWMILWNVNSIDVEMRQNTIEAWWEKYSRSQCEWVSARRDRTRWSFSSVKNSRKKDSTNVGESRYYGTV